MRKSGHTEKKRLLLPLLLASSTMAWAGGVPTLDTISVTAGSEDLVGSADSATQGTVTAKQLQTRPLLRPAEVLETVPGLIITQHSGDGKANQYFLRGFNLDHGTDFATLVDGMPVNMPSHAHGQGYSDLNFLIPELVDNVQYRKGPYSAQDGDFAAAGSARINYARTLPHDFVQLSAGENGYQRGLLGTSSAVLNGTVMTGLELYHYDGPWDVAENNRKLNGLLRYSQGSTDNGWSMLLMGYHDRWTATDQIAQRAVDEGLLDRYGSLNPSDGGETHRISLSSQWAATDSKGSSRANAYYIDYSLDLFSDFTYYLDNPARGDQVEQQDRRRIYGGSAAHTFFGTLGQQSSDTTVGTDWRYDHIGNVGLYLTDTRQRFNTVSQDQVDEGTAALFLENQTQWLPKFRSIQGLRSDFYHFGVDANLAANSGSRNAHINSPKLSLIFGPWAKTEYYANYGYGFHSNDARGTTLKINPDPRDPAFGQPADPVTPLVRARGGELGLRSAPLPGLQTTLALWQLNLESELVFQGDAGTTAASRPSRRRGLEWSNYYYPVEGLTLDADFAWSQARFTDADPVGEHIPGSIEQTFSAGLSYDRKGPWFAGLRLRYFGPRALIEDNSVRSASSTLVNAKLGYRLNPTLQLSIDLLNLLNRRVDDIQYFYNACLRNEAGDPRCAATTAARTGIADTYFHPAEPRELRLSARQEF